MSIWSQAVICPNVFRQQLSLFLCHCHANMWNRKKLSQSIPLAYPKEKYSQWMIWNCRHFCEWSVQPSLCKGKNSCHLFIQLQYFNSYSKISANSYVILNLHLISSRLQHTQSGLHATLCLLFSLAHANLNHSKSAAF